MSPPAGLMADSESDFQATRFAPEWQIHRAVVAPAFQAGIFWHGEQSNFAPSRADRTPAKLKVGAARARWLNIPAAWQGARPANPVARLELPQRRQLYTP